MFLKQASVAQGIEQWFPVPCGGGSNPSRRVLHWLIWNMTFRNLKKQEVYMKFSINGIIKIVKSNWKYIAGSLAFVVLVIVLVNLSAQEEQEGKEKVAKSETVVQEASAETETVEPATTISVDEHPEIDELIQKYFTSMANNDIETLRQILVEVLPEDEVSVKTGSEQIEQYDNVVCYTKTGNVENSYIVFASYEVKFVGINTTAPGLLSFYVITKEDGSLCIQNKLDEEVKDYIQDIIVEDKEVADLFEASQKRYEQALSDDADLKAFVEGLESKNDENSETVTENTEGQEETSTEQTTETTESTQETETTGTASYVKAKENVNVRNDASESADAIGKLLGGETAEKTGEKDGWVCINYKGQQGYVKADFVEITSEGSSSATETTESTESSTGQGKVYVKETVNIRSGMSQDSDRLGTAYAGDSFTKIEESGEWTKIDYKGSEAYIKTEFLETR